MTIIDFLRDTYYSHKYVLEKVMSHILAMKREDLIRDMDRELSMDEQQEIRTLYDRYAVEKQPLEYVLGYVEFFDRQFEVSPATLIPRPETEYMIEAVIEHVAIQWNQSLVLCDIGTWCGVLGTSVLTEYPHQFSSVFLTDISNDALEVARRNVTTHVNDSHNVHFLVSNLLHFWDEYASTIASNPLVLVANLPYIPDQVFDERVDETVKKREPRFAFVWGDDGLDLYRVMFKQLRAYQAQWIVKDHCLFLEMMTRQMKKLQEEYADQFVFEEVKTFHFQIRIVKAVLK